LETNRQTGASKNRGGGEAENFALFRRESKGEEERTQVAAKLNRIRDISGSEWPGGTEIAG